MELTRKLHRIPKSKSKVAANLGRTVERLQDVVILWGPPRLQANITFEEDGASLVYDGESWSFVDVEAAEPALSVSYAAENTTRLRVFHR